LGNIFDARLGKTEAQLLRVYILSALVRLSDDRTFRGITGEDIVKCLNEIGFGQEIAMQILTDLCDLRFAFTTSHAIASETTRFSL